MVTDADYTNYILGRGRGRVCEVNGKVLGFAIVDILDKNVWGLFVDPSVEKNGIGKRLHNMMLACYISCCDNTLFLSVEPGTKAEIFYLQAGWVNAGPKKSGEKSFGWKKHISTKPVNSYDFG
jgi:GNAT superfamily N-acetyltransferase